MQWLLTAHVRRYHAMRGRASCGRVWQGRFKAFPIQQDEHLLTVLRYVERIALRANIVRRAEDWAWSSARTPGALQLCSPLERPEGWSEFVNAPQTPAEIEAIQRSVARGAPLGSEAWVAETASSLGLESSLRPRGRPPKDTAALEG